MTSSVLYPVEPAPKKPRSHRSSIVLCALLGTLFGTFITLGVVYYLAQYWKAQVVASAQKAAATAAATAVQEALAAANKAASPAMTSPAAPTDADIVGDGGGIENPLISQIAANLSLVDFIPCRNRQMAKQRAGCNAHLLALRSGLVWKLGAEMWVKHPGTVAFHIEKDAAGNLKVVQYAASKTPHGNVFTLVTAYPVAPSVAASHFIGPTDGTTTFQTPYLSMHIISMRAG